MTILATLDAITAAERALAAERPCPDCRPGALCFWHTPMPPLPVPRAPKENPMDLTDVLSLLPGSQSGSHQQRMTAELHPIAAITIRDAQTIRDSLNRYGQHVDASIRQAAREVALGRRKDGRAVHECIAAGRALIDGAANAAGREPAA